MVLFFFYNKLTNIELLKKINNKFDVCDGYIIMQNYDTENNILEISDKSINNNKILYGKIVKFDMNLVNVLEKINEIEECRIKNKNTKYNLEKIRVNKICGYFCETYIIY